MRNPDDPNPRITAVVGLLAALGLIVVIIALQAWFFGAQRSEQARKSDAGGLAEIGQVPAGTADALGSYRWIDQPKGIVGIPIERAMALVVQEQGSAASR